MTSSQVDRPVLFPVLLVNFIGMLGYSLVIPILVFIVEDFGGNAVIYGIVGSIYPIFQLVGAPILGKMSDRIGRKKVLMISQAGTFLAWCIFILSLLIPVTGLVTIEEGLLGSFVLTIPLIMVFIARALDGLTGGNISVANAYLSDISTEENRKANFGKMASSTSLGFIVGPAIAGVLAASFMGELLPVIVAALISLIAIFVIQWFLPESKQQLVAPDEHVFASRKMYAIEQKECYEMAKCTNINFSGVLKLPSMKRMFLIYFLTFLGFSIYQVSLPIYAANDLGWSAGQLGMYLTIFSIVMVLAQGPLLTYLSQKVTDELLIWTGSISLILGFGLMIIPSIAALYAALIFIGIGNGVMWPSFLSLLSGTGPSSIQGTVQGYANSMGSAASIFGLLLGGGLFALFGTSVFVISALAYIGILILSIPGARTNPQPSPG